MTMHHTTIITGGAGFIGNHLARYLLAQNHKVIVIDNLSNGRLKNIDDLLSNKNFTFYQNDINDIQNLTIEHFDYFIHLAGLADIVPSIEKPEDYFEANVQGTLSCLEFAKKNSNLKKFIYAASSSCYGDYPQTPTKEMEPIHPKYPYALTKRLGEELVLHWGQVYKLPIISLRFFNVYGPKSRTNGQYGAMFGVFLKQRLDNKPLTIVGDGSQKRDFLYVSDAVQSIWMAMLSPIVNEVFNIGKGSPVSVIDIANQLSNDKVFIPKRPGEPEVTWADISKAKEMLGWEPQIDIQHGIKKMLENIDYWQDAPLWEPDSIQSATKSWFKYLGSGH